MLSTSTPVGKESGIIVRCHSNTHLAIGLPGSNSSRACRDGCWAGVGHQVTLTRGKTHQHVDYLNRGSIECGAVLSGAPRNGASLRPQPHFPLHINGESRFCHFSHPSMHRPPVTIDGLLPVRMEMTEHTKLLANQNSTWDTQLLRSSVASAEDNASP
jgi:hypothetical protein